MAMLVIRDNQMVAMDELMRVRFIDEVAAQLRTRLPESVAALTATALGEKLAADMETAASYGIEEEVDIRRYLEYSTMFGSDFHTALPWAVEILTNASLSGARKMNQIDDYALFAPREFS